MRGLLIVNASLVCYYANRFVILSVKVKPIGNESQMR